MSKFSFGDKKSPIQANGYKYYVPPPAVFSGWKFYCLVGGMVSFVALMMYPIAIDPVLNIDKYKKMHEEVQTELFQSGLLPGQLRKWEDPFKRFRDKKDE